MPFTPFHMGPGVAIKALLHGSFSLTVFGWTQILIDLQPLFVLLRGTGKLHGLSHTYLGAAALALLAALSGKFLAERGLAILAASVPRAPRVPRISWPVAFASAFIGAVMHIVLDSIMHADMRPWYPLTNANGLLGTLSYAQLHQLCLFSGLLGALAYGGGVLWLVRRNS